MSKSKSLTGSKAKGARWIGTAVLAGLLGFQACGTVFAEEATLVAVRDTLLMPGTFNNHNFGAHTATAVGMLYLESENLTNKTIIAFDLGSLVGGYTAIQSVTLRLHVNGYAFDAGANPEIDHKVYALSATNTLWPEGTAGGDGVGGTAATWSYRNATASTPWAGGAGLADSGVSYVNTLLAEKTFEVATPPAVNSAVDFTFNGTTEELKTLVDGWMTNNNQEVSLLIFSTTAGPDGNTSRILWHSREETTSGNKAYAPRLIVAYTPVPQVSTTATADNTILSLSGFPNNNYGAANNVPVGYFGDDTTTPTGVQKGLFRFALSESERAALTNAPVQIESITLRLIPSFVELGPPRKLPSLTCEIYEIAAANADWQEGTGTYAVPTTSGSTWNNKNQTGPVPWAGSAGLGTAGTDYVNTLLATRTFETNALPAANAVVNFDFSGTPTQLHALVTGWANAGQCNLLMLPNSPAGPYSSNHERIVWHAREETTSGSGTFAPRLIIRYKVIPPAGTVIFIR